MINPILSKLNATSNPLALISALKNGNPDALYNQLMQSNPQFSQFINAVKGKSPEEICQQYGVDPALISQFMK